MSFFCLRVAPVNIRCGPQKSPPVTSPSDGSSQLFYQREIICKTEKRKVKARIMGCGASDTCSQERRGLFIKKKFITVQSSASGIRKTARTW